MKKKKWCISFCLISLLTGVFSMTACGSGNGEQKDQGSFIEQKVKLPQGADIVLDAACMKDGSWGIACFNKKETEGSVWKSKDEGKNWEKSFTFTEKLPMNKIKASQAQWQAALSPSGEVFAYAEGEKEQHAYLVEKGGKKMRELKVKGGVFKADFAQDSSLLVETADLQLQKIDKASGSVQNDYLDRDNKFMQLNAFYTEDGVLYAFFTEKVLGFSIETGETVQVSEEIQNAAKKVDNSDNFETNSNQRFIVSKDQLYSMDKYGINLYEAGNSKLLIDGKETCMYSNQSSLYAFEKMDKDHLIAAAFCDGEYSLFTYAFDPGNSKEKEELTLYTLLENRDFNNAIGRYQRNNPSIRITVQTGITKDKGVTRSDALKTLNADILAGNGPDLICLNDMPVDNFIENALLEDLSKQIKAVDKKEGLLTNITGSYEKNEKICAVPTQFALMSIVGTKEVVKTGNNLAAFLGAVEKLSQKEPALEGYCFNNNVLLLYRTFLTPLIAENGDLTEKELREFYEGIYKLRQLYDEKELADQEIPLSKMELQPYYWPSVSNILEGNRKVQINYLYTFNDFQQLKALKKQKNQDYRLLGIKGNQYFAPQHIIGVNSKSEKKEAAKDFVSFMLTKEAQECYYFFGGRVSMSLPVNQKLIEDQINLSAGALGTVEGSKEIELDVLSKQDQNVFLDTLKSVTVPANTDSLFKDIVINQLESYLKGDQCLEQAVDNAMKKIRLYLAE